MVHEGCKIGWKIKALLERSHCGSAGNSMDKDNKGQKKLVDSGGRLLPAKEGHGLA